MSGFRDLRLLTSYHKGANDIAEEFYLPCMRQAMNYDRAVGFFNSTIYTIAWAALKEFVGRGGKIRIICSPVLSDEDIKALEEGYDKRLEEVLCDRICNEIHQLLDSPSLERPARVLASLVTLGVIDLRVAFISSANVISYNRLFHDKLGIFTDSEGASVIFKGSMNETWSGLSNDGNLESVDVFVSWEGDRELARVNTEIGYFDLLWNDNYPTVKVRPFPDIARNEFVRSAATENWEELVDQITSEIEISKDVASKLLFGGREPRPHQTKALAAWEVNNRRGIFEHATGSGKTFTALCAIRKSLVISEIALVLVPSEILLFQWLRELQEMLSDLQPNILVCGGGHSEWREERLLSAWTRPKRTDKPRIVLSTIQTAISPDFQMYLQQGEHIFIVVDEVHRVGSPEYQKLLSINSGPRLGLSATPRRAGDPEGTRAILNYFQGIVPPVFTLKDAIPSALTPYFYYVHPIRFTDDEQAEWEKISKRVSQNWAQQRIAKAPDPAMNNRIKMLLIERARIVKSAGNKIKMAMDIVKDHFEDKQQWIVYCDSLSQVQALNGDLRQMGFPSIEYHSAMIGDREQTLRVFETNGGILVSIRCLDEGVDIPAVTHALILASSKNPREFIQRRGRVLRKAPGKHVAHIHDVLVLPNNPNDNQAGLSIVESELIRSIEFGRWAENPSSITDLERIALEFDLDFNSLSEGGFEDDDE